MCLQVASNGKTPPFGIARKDMFTKKGLTSPTQNQYRTVGEQYPGYRWFSFDSSFLWALNAFRI